MVKKVKKTAQNLGPRVVDMLRAPHRLNPALVLTMQLCSLASDPLFQCTLINHNFADAATAWSTRLNTYNSQIPTIVITPVTTYKAQYYVAQNIFVSANTVPILFKFLCELALFTVLFTTHCCSHVIDVLGPYCLQAAYLQVKRKNVIRIRSVAWCRHIFTLRSTTWRHTEIVSKK